MLRKILSNCIPTICAIMISSLYSVIDGFFVGSATGDVGLAAINLAWPITAFITAIGFGIGTGGSIIFSNYKGRDDKENCENVFQTTMSLIVLAGIMMGIILYLTKMPTLNVLGARGEVFDEALNYSRIIILGTLFQILGTGVVPILRNMDMAVQAMLAMVSGVISNLVTNYILIMKVGLGIQGAAIGTILSQMIVAFISMWLIYGKQKKKIQIKLSRQYLAGITKTAISAFGVSFGPSVALVLTNWQCLKFGGNGTVACYAVISYLVFPIQAMLAGVGDGLQPLMSFYNGIRNVENLKKVRNTGIVICTVLGVSLFTLILLLNRHIPVWFGMEAGKESFYEGIIISSFSFFVYGIVKLNIAYENAILRTLRAAWLTYAEMIIVSPLIIIVLPMIMGIKGIWASLPVTSLVMLVIYKVLKIIEIGSVKNYENKNRYKR